MPKDTEEISEEMLRDKLERTLEEVYLNSATPYEMPKPKNSRYYKAVNCILFLEEVLLAKINDEEKEIYQKLKDSLDRAYGLEKIHVFVEGYKLGVLTRLENIDYPNKT